MYLHPKCVDRPYVKRLIREAPWQSIVELPNDRIGRDHCDDTIRDHQHDQRKTRARSAHRVVGKALRIQRGCSRSPGFSLVVDHRAPSSTASFRRELCSTGPTKNWRMRGPTLTCSAIVASARPHLAAER